MIVPAQQQFHDAAKAARARILEAGQRRSLVERAALAPPKAEAAEEETKAPEVDPVAQAIKNLIEKYRRSYVESEGEAELPRPVKVSRIVTCVAEHYGVTEIDIKSARRQANIIIPRHVAMYLAKTLTTKSLPEIGRRLGGRDHTSCLFAIRKITRLLETDVELQNAVSEITAKIGGNLAPNAS